MSEKTGARMKIDCKIICIVIDKIILGSTDLS